MTQSGAFRLPIAGDAGLRAAPTLHAALRHALTENECVELDLAALESADVSLVQLLASARKTALAEGKTLTLATPVSPVLNELLATIGLGADGADAAFWHPASARKDIPSP